MGAGGVVRKVSAAMWRVRAWRRHGRHRGPRAKGVLGGYELGHAHALGMRHVKPSTRLTPAVCTWQNSAEAEGKQPKDGLSTHTTRA